MTANTASPAIDQARLRAIFESTVHALKGVVREHRITEDELHIAGDYLNRLGQSGMCRSLIDVALAMTSIDVHASGRPGTRANLTGPYHAAHPIKADGKLLEKDVAPDAPRLQLSGVVRDAATGQPIAGAQVDLWSADHLGIYDRQGTHLRGIVLTDAQGRYAVETLLPSDYAEHDHDPVGELFRAMGRTNTRAAHVHARIGIDQKLCLTTQVFMSHSDTLKTDYVEGAVTEDLIAQLERVDGAAAPTFAARFDFDVQRPV
ncbi:dioxygenase family protein [Hydrogenophaga sp. BPS33]|uniref:dioxygenase family protein n=1 Tax=Hydrogenophaga sp. BPS33 TaxID=2651974 RepID=UPI00135852E7|nr:dioxygenase [Hydrogenophaga sp. BPS33]